ncbi:MAG: hypothetical protein JWQ35_2660, partial [Bacteriovoracaceae bacterium]|nr:hypothetical protein [Bacteriovoracaceae bacterium]
MKKTVKGDSSNVISLVRAKSIRTLSESGSAQTEIFRQKRIDNSSGQLRLKVGQESYKLINWSRTGLAFEVPGSTNPFPIGLKVGPTRIFVGDIEVYEGDLEICSARESNEGNRTLGAIFKSQLFLVEGIEAASQVNRCVATIQMHQNAMEEVSAEVCKVIVDMG